MSGAGTGDHRGRATRFARRDHQFAEYRTTHADVSFGQYRAKQIHDALAVGKHHYSLGANLSATKNGPQEFWVAGAAKAAYYFRKMGLKPHHRVIDYGCGSLRIGAHFIRYLNPGCYLGLDVIPDFFEIGKQLVGEELMAAKRPSLSVLNGDAISVAAGFGADFVFSAAVCTHVHPDELEIYLQNLLRLTNMTGAQLHLNAALSDRPRRISYDSWAWPREFLIGPLADLRLIAAPRGATRLEHGQPLWPADLVFRREATTQGRGAGWASTYSKFRLLTNLRTYGFAVNAGALVKRVRWRSH